MPFIPHTEQDIEVMLAAIGVETLDDLFDEVPCDLPLATLDTIPLGSNEFSVSRLAQERMPTIKRGTNYIGAGAYEHYIPAVVWQLAGRGEFYTAYTPYQAEASQGSLQVIFEYQSMMAELMQMEVSNASLYDGATALCEGVLMAVRLKKGKARRVIVPTTLNPAYRRVLETLLPSQGIELICIDFDVSIGGVDPTTLSRFGHEDVAALVITQPNFFGVLEPTDALTNWAHAHDLLVIATVNPIAMALLKPPGCWGERGADIVCGEGQPLGAPLSFGGPYFGFLCTRKALIRQMPGRLVGKTKDCAGKPGYVLTLQAREQHIRRAKATSNICTNQGLLVVAAALYLSLLGSKGLREVAIAAHQHAVYLSQRLTEIPGVSLVFHAPFWHEFVVRLPQPVSGIQAIMRSDGLECGYNIESKFPGLKNCLLVCVTETKTKAELDNYVCLMKTAIKTMCGKGSV